MLLAIVVLAATGCGGGGETFTAGEADRALAALDALEAAVADGHCGTAESRVNALIGQAQAVNRDRADLGAAYAQSVDRLQQLVTNECREAEPEPTEPVTGETGQTETSEPTPEPTAPVPVEPTGGGAEPTSPVTPEPQPPAGGDDQTGGIQPQ